MKGSRVLVVEDDALLGMALAETLSDMGYVVCGIEASGVDAVAAAAREKPDLLIVDAHLTDSSGPLAVAEILRSGFIPHLFVTGDYYTARSLKLTSVVIEKPFQDRDLAQAIGRAFAATPRAAPEAIHVDANAG